MFGIESLTFGWLELSIGQRYWTGFARPSVLNLGRRKLRSSVWCRRLSGSRHWVTRHIPKLNTINYYYIFIYYIINCYYLLTRHSTAGVTCRQWRKLVYFFFMRKEITTLNNKIAKWGANTELGFVFNYR